MEQEHRPTYRMEYTLRFRLEEHRTRLAVSMPVIRVSSVDLSVWRWCGLMNLREVEKSRLMVVRMSCCEDPVTECWGWFARMAGMVRSIGCCRGSCERERERDKQTDRERERESISQTTFECDELDHLLNGLSVQEREIHERANR